MSKLFSSAAIGWFGRRILDWGGWLGTFIGGLLAFYNTMPPAMQQVIVNLLSSRWDDITLGAFVGFGALIFSQVQSFLATTQPQVVTTDGDKIDIRKELDVADRRTVEAVAKDATVNRAPKPNLLERLFGRS